MAGASGPSAWRLAGGCDLRWRQFDDDWVVYDRGSGNTMHLLAWPATVLGLLESGPRAVPDLLGELHAELVTEPAAAADSALSDALHAALKHLNELGLVQTSGE